jgi:ribosomal protein L16 Arg81 hydroxylase
VALFERLHEDLRVPEKFVGPASGPPAAVLSFAQAGAHAPLHVRTRNLLLAQITGHERIVLLPPSESARLYPSQGTRSQIPDVLAVVEGDPRFARAFAARRYEMQLAPGEMLFVPIGWWLQATALELSVSAAYTEFRWPNDAGDYFPSQM